MKHLLALLALAAGISSGGCGVARHPAPGQPAPRHIHVRKAIRAAAATSVIQALVTAQTENRLLVVGLPGGRPKRELNLPGDPGYVDATGRVIVVVSSRPGVVTLLDRKSLRVIRVFHGFSAPHIPAISPDGRYAYVTDDGSGALAAISLDTDRLTSRVFVGTGAHHLAFSPDGRHVWVALGQTAQTLTLLSAADAGHPRVVGHLTPPFLAHDLMFGPGGREVWITSASTSYVGVFSAQTRRLLFRVPAGPPPQHLVFARGAAYITSGYGGSIERVDLHTGRTISRVFAPYGSFDLDAAGPYVVTASLLRGTLAIYDRRLQLLHVAQLAPSTEDVALAGF